MMYAIHPLAALIPAMTDDQFAELRADIEQHGLMSPIVLYEHMVLDGRHRLRACEETGVEPRYEDFTGPSPVEFVLAVNVKRRHLTPGQRAAIGVAFLPAMEAEHARAKAAAAKSQQDAQGRFAAVGDPGITNGHKAREDAGELVGVSGASIDRAKRVQRKDPDLFEQVKAGEIALRTADNTVREPRAPKSERPARVVNPTDRQLQMAHANLTRLRKAFFGLDGLMLGFEQLDPAKFALVVTPADIAEFDGTITRSLARLRALRSTLREYSDDQDHE